MIQKPAVLRENDSGYRRELNVVSWNGNAPKLDPREWGPEHRAKKGFTLTDDEAQTLLYVLTEYLVQKDTKALIKKREEE